MMNITLRKQSAAGNPHIAPTLRYGGTGRFDEGDVALENPRRGFLFGIMRPMVMLLLGLMIWGSSAMAETFTWIWREDVGTSPMNPALWTDGNNWEYGLAPSDAKDFIDLTAATNRYIRIDDDVTILRFQGCVAGHPVLFGNGTLTVTGISGNVNNTGKYVSFFLPLTLKNSTANTYMRFGVCEIAADMTLTGDGSCSRDGIIRFRQDWYANDTASAREMRTYDKFRMAVHYEPHAFYGIPALASDATSTWTLTKDSPYATRVGTVEHNLPVGTLVTCGDLLPAGTFLKRIFPDGTIEFSQPATDGVAEGSVTFAAFAPSVTYYIKESCRTTKDGGGTLYLNAYADSGALTVDIGEAWSEYSEVGTSYYATCDTGFVPGKLRLHNVTKVPYLTLRKGVVEFSGKDASGTDAGLPNGTLIVNQGTENEICVTNGITARIKAVYRVQGTVNKTGAGTLVLPADLEEFNWEGLFVIREGAVAFADSADGSPVSIPGSRFTVKSGAVLQLPPVGVRISEIPTCEAGASIAGPAVLVVADSLDVSSLPLADNVQVMTASQFDGISSTQYTWSAIPAATSPSDEGLPVPASWMDASKADSLVTSNGETQVCLLMWKDVRGGAEDGYPVANAAGASLYPQVVTNAAGKPHHVYIESVLASDDITVTHAMTYSKEIPKVRAIFKVYNGLGQIVCGPGSTSYSYMRDWASSCSQHLFAYNPKGMFYVNGSVRDQTKGYPYCADAATDKSQFDPLVGEFHCTDAGNLPTARNIGFYSGGGNQTARNGEERTCEMILYTNELTFVQRQKICAYLMKKWMRGAEANQDYSAVMGAATFEAVGEVSVPVAEGRSTVVEALAGEGTLVKSGAGDLYVKTLENAAGGLRVSSGKATVSSIALERSTLPGDPYLHLDASDATTITEGPTAGTIAAMADVRGAGHPSATVVTAASGMYPTLVANAQGTLPMVDYGSGVYAATVTSKLTGLRFPETDRLYAVFRIAGGRGGGVVAGYMSAQREERGGVLCSLPRTEWGTDYFQKSAWITTGGIGNRAMTKLINTTGGTMFRLDGADAAMTDKHTTDTVQLLMLNGYDRIYSDSLGCCYAGNGKYWGGWSRDGETILYTNALSRASALKVEAYLNKKWFGVETPGYRPAFVGTLAVDAGATLEVVGGAPVSVTNFTCAGTINGAVELAAAGELTVDVASDGTVVPVNATSLKVNGGTVRLTGATKKLPKFVNVVLANGVTGSGAWTVIDAGDNTHVRQYVVQVVGTQLVLNVIPRGTCIFVR